MPEAVTLEHRREAERQKYIKLQPTGYGGTNHGKRAMVTVLSWQPRFVVDFGCGRNDFIRELRRRGVDGLGIDFAINTADIVAPMHAVPLAGGIADVVTSFDALEHLLPEDVDATLSEMRRVCKANGRFVFSICTRPSRITVDGQNLHPTVKPTAWWLDRIARVGHVETADHYIAGVFHA